MEEASKLKRGDLKISSFYISNSRNNFQKNTVYIFGTFSFFVCAHIVK